MLRASGEPWGYPASAALILALLACVTAFSTAAAQVNVTTQLNDIGRTGQNTQETALTPANVNPAQFGKLFSRSVAGAIDAQPLYLSSITINGAVHNVVYVVTQPNHVYAFDANSNYGANSSPLWYASMLTAAHGAAPGAQIYGDLGSTSTPVIDPVSGTMYLVSTTLESGAPVYRLHALDVTSGAEKFGGPTVIEASVPGAAADGVDGIVSLIPQDHNQRPGLLLLNGIVYLGFAAYHEPSTAVWHGWIVAYGATTLAQTGVFCVTANGRGGGVWLAGDGLAAGLVNPTQYPYGRMLVATGNGDFTGSVPFGINADYADSVLNLNLAGGAPTVTDDFTPNDQAMLGADDGDQGSGGVLILPTQTAGAYPNLLVQAGKSGTLYLLDRDNLGGYNTTNQVVQQLPLAVGNVGVWSSPAYWNGNVYYWGQYDSLKQFPMVNGLLRSPPVTSSEQLAFPGSTPSISANGTAQGIVWNIDADAWATGGPAILLAHDASNVSTTLYSSATDAARDVAGPAVRFSVPTIANGMVYVGAADELDVYGLISGAVTPTPIIAPGSESFVAPLSVTISDGLTNAAIYYTTDGSAASTASTPYTGPIAVQSGETINAIAAAPGLGVSEQTSASYTQPETATPTFSPAAVAYPSAQTVTISDATAGAAIYYTTNGTKPTTGSTPYSGPITVASSETVQAIALAPGYVPSEVGSAGYIVTNGSSIVVNEGAGFASAAGLNVVGTAVAANNALRLTVAGSPKQNTAVWYTSPVNVQGFTTDFYFQEVSATADGFTFTLQNSSAGLNAIGLTSAGLGYQGIGSSVAVKFDLYDNSGEGVDSSGFYVNGAIPTIPAVDMTGSGVNLHSTDILHAHITYDGTTLALTVTDTVTSESFTTATAINIPATVGANVAYAGFTAGVHGAAATQSILNWTYVASSGTPVAATPTFSPPAGAYAGAQSITVADATSGATLYYTTNGTNPTVASPPVTGPIAVSANETLKAIATAAGYSNSLIGTAAYQIQAPAPTFKPAAGKYPAPQSVAIAEGVGGATIYYTTDDTTPTTSSTPYTTPINVAADTTIKAIAVDGSYANSKVASGTFLIAAPTPTVSPPAGGYDDAQPVAITDAAGGATIYYTPDGTTPTKSSPVYGGPIIVSKSESVKALAVVSGYSPSAIGVAVYKITE